MLKNNMSARPDRIHAHVLKKPGVVACVQFTIIVNKSAYCQELECSTSTLPFFASGGWNFRFWYYFRLVARCIVHACVRRSYTMNSAYRIGPKWQQWSGWHSELLDSMTNMCMQVNYSVMEDYWGATILHEEDGMNKPTSHETLALMQYAIK